MTGHMVDAVVIDKDSFRVAPPRWILPLGILFLISINIVIALQPSEVFAFKWLIVAVLLVFLIGLLRATAKSNYLVTLAADRRGLYFQSTEIDKYFFVSWQHVRSIEKASFPVNTRGLRIAVDCEYYADAERELGNVKKEHGQCFIYTIPQLRSRARVIKVLEKIRHSSPLLNSY